MAVIKIRGIIVDLLLEIYPYSYGTFETTDKKGEKIIIVSFINALYGTIVASLL